MQIEKLFIDGSFLINKEVTAGAGTASDPSKMSHEKHLLQMKNFVGAIRGEEKLVSSAHDGYLAVRFVEDVYRISNKM